ncbi:MAG: hypothetical protein GPOALKHO_000606 [Sodalis sp.]|uniref:hypothetical protein n=1 Tax=Sodalis sp. (in: enterobacteria) TaxID=1898979 RepID=UPI003872B723|nr:MAG: hypothetical protein GPOALKHO_000606 [Sodalis sp.]
MLATAPMLEQLEPMSVEQRQARVLIVQDPFFRIRLPATGLPAFQHYDARVMAVLSAWRLYWAVYQYRFPQLESATYQRFDAVSRGPPNAPPIFSTASRGIVVADGGVDSALVLCYRSAPHAWISRFNGA